ncbi:MAG: hypothetical protein APR63_14640 [Desulfuromonas sp. SDB]|nr:MAG: hypothetical protein APR63_14640 [Desulfuromonas sp. SDB]
MKYLYLGLVCVLLINCGSGSFYRDVDPQQAEKLIRENAVNPQWMIIDLRSSREYNQGHLENAININYASDDFEQRIDSLDRDNTYLIYCSHGARSYSALSVFKRLEFTKVYSISGGMGRWMGQNLPVIKSPEYQ